jgi:hypothetical protein
VNVSPTACPPRARGKKEKRVKGRRIMMALGAVTLGLGLAATGALAKNACKKECVSQKQSRFRAAKQAKNECKQAAADKTARKECQTIYVQAKKQAVSDFHTRLATCKSDPTSTICSGASPSGAFLD